MTMSQSVAYIHSKELVTMCDRLPANRGRASQVHSLIEGYGLLKRLAVCAPAPATKDDLKEFHDEDYIEILLSAEDRAGGDDADDEIHITDPDLIETCAEFGLEDDCPVFRGLGSYASLVSGGALTAARLLCKRRARVAIHWNGGRHHGKTDKASGFCYINDVVLGILELRKVFSRVLYIDIDVHHGDGVEESFLYSPSVITLSFHKHELGFFPGSGELLETGRGPGEHYTVNVPLKGGMDGPAFTPLFTSVAEALAKRFLPEVVVMQCGADALQGDPTRAFNLSSECYAACLRHVLRWNLPTLVLGGGGYNNLNTAKCWTLLTAVCLEDLTVPAKPLAGLSEDLPEHDMLTEYAGEYTLPVACGNMKNENTPEELKILLATILANIDQIPPP